MLLRKKDNIPSISLSKVFYLKSINNVSSWILLNYDNIFINIIYWDCTCNPTIESINIVIIKQSFSGSC